MKYDNQRQRGGRGPWAPQRTSQRRAVGRGLPSKTQPSSLVELELSPAVAEAPPGVLVDFSQPGLDIFCQGIDESAVI